MRGVLTAFCVILGLVLAGMLGVTAYINHLYSQMNYVDPHEKVTITQEELEHLKQLEAEEADGAHGLTLTPVEDEWYVTLDHPMDKDHFISFLAWVGFDRVQIVKLYPQQEAAARLPRRGGKLYACCSRHGLFEIRTPRK